MKTIVTHFNPDLDAIGAIWLLKKYQPEFLEAEIVFVPAGETWQDVKVDEDENIIHVDTGLGKFDHHQAADQTCATMLIFNYLKKKRIEISQDQALIRLIKVIKQDDHFEDCLWPQPCADYWQFLLSGILEGLKSAGKLNDEGMVNFGCQCLDGVYTSLKIKIKAEKELKKGYQFKTKWGKALGCLTQNDEVLKLGQKQGFVIVVQKDQRTEQIRIKARPDSQVDLTGICEHLKQLDPQATWYLHPSKRMLLNGSSKNPKMKPTNLSLTKIIEVLEGKI